MANQRRAFIFIMARKREYDNPLSYHQILTRIKAGKFRQPSCMYKIVQRLRAFQHITAVFVCKVHKFSLIPITNYGRIFLMLALYCNICISLIVTMRVSALSDIQGKSASSNSLVIIELQITSNSTFVQPIFF